MKANLMSGFKKFFELANSPTMTRPDLRPFGSSSGDQAVGHGKDGAMDSLDVKAMELGVSPKAMGSVPDAFANIQIGKTIKFGPSSYIVVSVDDQNVKVRALDDGSKRFIKTPGALYLDPSKPSPQTYDIPRAYFVKMSDDQYGGASGAMAGPAGGGLPPMM
jgi:hypothetical protein